jgi:Flp pilus assembly protein TadD
VAAQQSALAKDATHPNAFATALQLGALFVRDGDLSAALSTYERARKLRPDSPTAHYDCGIILQKLGRFQEAVTRLENAIQLRDPYGQAHFALAGVYYKDLEDDEKALLHYRAAASDSAFSERATAARFADAIQVYLEKKTAPKK